MAAIASSASTVDSNDVSRNLSRTEVHMLIGAPEGEHVAQEEGIAHLSSRN